MSAFAGTRLLRGTAKRGVETAFRALELFDPTPSTAPEPPPVPPATLACIYRHTNASLVSALVNDAESVGWDVRLWALDDNAGPLGGQTVGRGQGSRLAILNRLLDPAPPSSHFVVICDDDVAFERGGVVDLVQFADGYAFDLCQPSHTSRSNRSHWINRRRPFHRARLTNFVEVGPVLAISPHVRPRVLPLPENFGMGWGLELVWAQLRDQGFRLGVVDAVSITHAGDIGAAYESDEEAARVREMLADRGYTRWGQYTRTLGRHWLWQRRPPWADAPDSRLIVR